MNQLHVVALNERVRRKKALCRPAGRSDRKSLILAPWASRRRQDLLDLLDQLTPRIQELTLALEEEVEKRPVARRLMTHPGVGVLTALAFELVIGRGRKIAKVAMARKLAAHLYWMWRKGWDYEKWKRFGSHAGAPGNRRGVE